MALHSFDPEVAKIVGVNAATIYQNIAFWIEKNQANEKHLYDGQYWTYNSVKAFGEQFPYLSADQIRNALKKLVEQGFIVKGDYNKANFDKTRWYGLGKKANSICEKSQMEMVKKANGVGKNPEPIPDSKPNIKPDRNQKRSIDQRYQDETDPLWVYFVQNVWAHCWRTGDSRKNAFKSFAKLTKPQKQALVEALPAAKRLFLTKDNDFRPMMATWINRNGWEEIQNRSAAHQSPDQSASVDWEARIAHWRSDNTWLPSWGPRPGEHGCQAPADLIETKPQDTTQNTLF
ncbi:hypothetical protein MXMO3_01790 [Maritalea myrionectae]|uniref:Uncharacterized protein n=1 Tax=Maritalea myrionectae TaxID=454601 RepID=A0A2R4MEE5_9HYPH|nr:hypothetical protein [Maritalea myrionectae]AVX04315.1 hypothetical protein MXMO3_01790 [Maritalea myrionectae]